MAGTFTGVHGTVEARFAKLVGSQAALPATNATQPTTTRVTDSRPNAAASGPNRDEIVKTLNQEVSRFVTSFNQCWGSDTEPLLDSLQVSDWANTQRTHFDQALSRVELTYVGRGLQGYLPEYATWLRYDESVSPVLPSGLRHQVGAFADYAVANHTVDAVQSLALDSQAGNALGKAVCLGGSDTKAIRSVSDMLHQVVAGGANGYSKQQIYYLLTLLRFPQATERVLYAELAGNGGWGAQSGQQTLALAAQKCANAPLSCQEPFFTVGAQALGFLNAQ